MPNWFKPGPSPHQTALAMIGAKAGDSVLVAGAETPDLAAAVAGVTGLNGQTLVVDARADRVEIVEAAAAKAGTLVEFTRADPDQFDAARPFDIAVLCLSLTAMPQAQREALFAHLARAVRPGGRIVIIDGRRSSGLLGGLSRSGPRLEPAVALALLDKAGLRATRLLAESEGVSFYEGRRP
jgi:ubiquinone/menaquinone biosynthesis C-methylase UbiE